MSDPHLHSELRRRLVAVLALDSNAPYTAETARDAIVGFCEGAVCCRIPLLNGKVSTFEAVYQAVFGLKLDGNPVTPKTQRAAVSKS